jgi:L-asparaginase/N4-(beta-N-acetylglucosaminyl)-L-asparaginase
MRLDSRRGAVHAFVLAVVVVLVGPWSLLSLGGCAGQANPARAAAVPQATLGPVLIATWPFGKIGTDLALARLAAGGSRLDAVEAGIREVERLSCDGSVGLGGRPNAAGYPQLDGPARRSGSVAGLEGIVHPITAARRVLERSPHVMLVGEGARWFALEHGVESVPIEALAAPKQAWVEGKRPAAPDRAGHDTVTLLLRDADGHLAGGCSTSGAGGKLPGRVGDSPIFGAGLFVDDEVGAAGATGIGENIMRYCGTCLVVERMRQGLSPQEACEAIVHHIARQDPRGYALDICFIAIDKLGRVGAAASNQTFPYAVTTSEGSRVLEVVQVTPR